MKQALIIGAGPAGLSAALELLTKAPKEYEVTVLEAESQVGGISKTVCHNGNRMDMGGHRFFSKSQRVNALWEELLPLQGAPAGDDLAAKRKPPLSPTGPDPEREDRVMLSRRRVSRIFFRKKFFDYPISMSPQTLKNMGFFTTLKAGASYLKAQVFRRKEHSLEDFYINRFGKVLYRMFFESYTEKLWGRHPREISPDWGAQRVKGLSLSALLKDGFFKLLGKEREKETSLIEEFRYPKYGPGQLWEEAAARICALGGKILLNTCVTGIRRDERGIRKLICRRGEEELSLEADAVFSSMPLKDLAAAMEKVPQEILAIAQGLPYRDFVTLGLLVDRLAVKNETELATSCGQIPDCWIYVQDGKVSLGRIQIFNNWSPYMVKDPRHSLWLGLEFFCREGDGFWELSEEALLELAVKELKSMGLLDESCRILDHHREKVKKAYPAYFDSYAQIDRLIAFLNGIPNLYCIGRNGQHRYNNMDHSMLSAAVAVELLVTSDPRKERLWQVNTEKEYHETRAKHS